jgi:hypothetical protein
MSLASFQCFSYFAIQYYPFLMVIVHFFCQLFFTLNLFFSKCFYIFFLIYIFWIFLHLSISTCTLQQSFRDHTYNWKTLFLTLDRESLFNRELNYLSLLWLLSCFFVALVPLRFELRASHLLGSCTTT